MRRGEMGEERREEKREIHVDEDRARRSSPSPTQKVVPCTSCCSTHSRASMEKKEEWDGKEKKEQIPNTCKSIKLAMCVIWVI
jgi:hypothetical protein